MKINRETGSLSRRFCIAPMMDCTDRHFRFFARLMTQHALLYTEMVTAEAIIHGDRDYLLGCDAFEQPVALQLGGSNPHALAESAKIGEQYGYQEINLNVGCPSDRVQAGRFGACLMKEPQLVAECVMAMQRAVCIPVTLKTRLGVDAHDSDELLHDFVRLVFAAGCTTFIVHARKAWLQGLSPRENRHIPPLQYERVYHLKKAFPQLEIIINGGITEYEDVALHLNHVDGVMLGREVYANPYFLAGVDQRFFDAAPTITDELTVIARYQEYVNQQLALGVPSRVLIRYLVGLFKGQPGARQWRRYVSEHSNRDALASNLWNAAHQFLGLQKRDEWK